MSIKFKKIKNDGIFTNDFESFINNNEISFTGSKKIAVIYGPNGTGKTSLVKVLSDEKGSEIDFDYCGQNYKTGKDIFHIINDQNNRNIISGDTKDFFLGDNIKREFELKAIIDTERESIITSIVTSLKSHGISAANSPLIDLISFPDIVAMIKDIANNKSKGAKYSTEDLVTKLKAIPIEEIVEYEEVKLQFLQNDIANKDGFIQKIMKIHEMPLVSNPHIHQIEENTEAINILNRFHTDQCIVCDNTNIDWETLLASKTANRTRVIGTLSEDVKPLIEKIIASNFVADPFEIKTHLMAAISAGNNANIIALITEFDKYKAIFCQIVLNDLAALLSKSELSDKMTEYQKLLAEKLEVTDEDMLYIEEIISNSMDKKLELRRDKNNNLKLFLSNQEFLGKSRNELPLSNGEQNFLSLTFEFLKAKNSICPVVIVDDPISSFDSIYKNKVVFAIVKMLEKKERMVLTHNTDLIRLLGGQFKGSYNLYLLNNIDSEENGFIALKNNEQEMLISLEKLLEAFRSNIFPHIQNTELFLIAMIPFMRGYAHIINNTTVYNDLTQLMHGYMTNAIDVAVIYTALFGSDGGVLPASYNISVSDILAKNVDGIHILDKEQCPLLDKTLRHSFTYLYLRLMVEKALVDKFHIDTSINKQLGQIISAAYPGENDITAIKNRIRLNSKKTLINEFNHFEGNLSIFQPAIDISDQALNKEKADIIAFVNNI